MKAGHALIPLPQKDGFGFDPAAGPLRWDPFTITIRTNYIPAICLVNRWSIHHTGSTPLGANFRDLGVSQQGMWYLSNLYGAKGSN